MTWSDEVHRNHVRQARRKPALQASKFCSSADAPANSGALPIIMVGGVLCSMIWWSKERHKLGGARSPLDWLQSTLQRLKKPARQQQQQQQQDHWREQRPGSLAAAAAQRRLQESQDAESSSSSAASKKKNKKKKKKGK